MRRALYSRKLWFTIIVIIVSVISITVYNNLSFLMKNWFDSLTIFFGILGILSTLYNHWGKFNLLITKLWIILYNSSSIWNITANFEGEFNEEDFKRAIEKIRDLGRISDYLKESDQVVRTTVDGLNYIFEYVEIEDEDGISRKGKLLCVISDFNSSYDNSIDILENNVIPYFRIIENNCRPDNKIFKFKVSFKGKNPFIKQIAKNVNTSSINNLWYSLEEDTKVGRKSVKITKTSIECTTSDISDFQKTSTNYISLVGG